LFRISNPLAGKSVVVTRAIGQADELISHLQRLGAEVIHIPTIEIVPPDSWADCDRALEKLHDYHWLIFTSTNGVRFFFRRLKDRGKKVDALKKKQIAAVGERTEEVLKELGIQINLVPHDFSSEDLVEEFQKKDIVGLRILLPKADKGRDVLKIGLTAMGGKVDAVTVYKNQPTQRNNLSEYQKLLHGNAPDVLTFTSPSTLRNFISLFGAKRIYDWQTKGCRIAAIGKVTAEALEKHELSADVFPDKSTIPGLAVAIGDSYR